MKQTVRQKSLQLNTRKWAELEKLATAYAKQKDVFLAEYGHIKYLHCLGHKRRLRDELVAQGFKSPFGLQARQWKLALEDALYTLERQWEAAIARARKHLHRHQGLSEEEKHYAYWLLQKNGNRDWQRLQAIFNGKDTTHEKITLGAAGRKKVRNYLRRTFRKALNRRPRVKKARSFVIDREMYRVFSTGKRQYISIASLEPGKRIIIPLAGRHGIEGNLRIVLEPESRTAEIHIAQEPRTYDAGEEIVGIDLGITEVFTDDEGRKYRPDYGKALEEMSEGLLKKGRKRQKLWALYRRNLKTDSEKARRIKRNNLGTKKLRRRHERYRRRCENEINRAFNELYKTRKPKAIAYEDLSHLRGKAKSRGLSRKVSNWHRSFIKARLEYKSHVYSVNNPGPVNAAYSSQTCPVCGWVDAKNRQGDEFKCQKCGHKANADHVAAVNLKNRLNDEEITRYLPRQKVKEILLLRYRQKQANQARVFR